MADDLIFAPEDAPHLPTLRDQEKWTLLIVDDDQEVHSITQLVLKDFTLEGRGLEMISAYSGVEAKEMLLQHPDTALVLLDVVMETDYAGLELVRWIREDWKNSLIRIILRTGQPGLAPEKRVISEFRINDYKDKTELTELKLFTAVTVAIRNFQDLKMLKRSEAGFRRIVQASGELFRNRNKQEFYSGILLQLTSLLRLDEDSLFLRSEGLALENRQGRLILLAGTGGYSHYEYGQELPLDNPILRGLISRALEEKRHFFDDHHFVGYFTGEDGGENLILFFSAAGFHPLDKEMIRVFSSNIVLAFANIDLSQQIESTQRDLIFTLGEVVESRSQETGNHVRRVGALAALLGQFVGLSDREVEALRAAAPMHDVGKIGVPDSILHKPGPLSQEELLIMRRHTLAGQEILKGGTGILQMAAVIARSHHERWDGKGYPDGLAGESIPLVARITGLVDVFDALLHERHYKGAWTEEEALAYLRENRGTHFDPHLLDLFFSHLKEVRTIIQTYQD